jgi:hypothetical protein
MDAVALREKALDEIIAQAVIVNDSLIQSIDVDKNKSLNLLGFFISICGLIVSKYLTDLRIDIFLLCIFCLSACSIVRLLRVYLYGEIFCSATSLETNIEQIEGGGIIAVKEERIRTLDFTINKNSENHKKYNQIINVTALGFIIFSIICFIIFSLLIYSLNSIKTFECGTYNEILVTGIRIVSDYRMVLVCLLSIVFACFIFKLGYRLRK